MCGISYGPASVYVFVLSQYCFETATWAVFWHKGFSPLILPYVVRKTRYLQNKGTFLLNFSQTMEFIAQNRPL